MPRLDEIAGQGQEILDVPSLPWLTGAIGEGFVRGGVYLLAGEPGIGKTNLSLQVLGDVAQRDIIRVVRDIASEVSLRASRTEPQGNPTERAHATLLAYFTASHVTSLYSHATPRHADPDMVLRIA